MKTYYNEFDSNAAQWLRNLGAGGLINQGVIDERSIKEVRKADLKGVTRAHFFAGIGGWDLALRLAGWPEDREVWTGSCPCQPYSSAGKQEGDSDPRNLWPDFFRIIKERRPGAIFGEQVASAIKHGWLDRVFADLEGIGYACWPAVLGAHSVGANHIRQRLYWGAALGVSKPERDRRDGRASSSEGDDFDGKAPGRKESADGIADNRAISRIQHPEGDRRFERRTKSGGRGIEFRRGVSRISDDERRQHEGSLRESGFDRKAKSCGASNDTPRYSPASSLPHSAESQPWDGEIQRGGMQRFHSENGNDNGSTQDPEREKIGIPSRWNAWSDFRIVLCSDGKARRTGTGVFPLAYGIPRGMGGGSSWRKGLARGAGRARIGMLKGSGNAIVPALAAEFIMASMEVLGIAHDR